MSPREAYTRRLAALAAEGNLRRLPSGAPAPAAAIDFSGNDYLGIAASGAWQREFLDSGVARRARMGACASRLLASDQEEPAALEALLASLYGAPALLFNSGYHANTGLLQALASEPGTLVVADRLVHASIIDGITLSRAPFERFRHNDLAHLERLLERRAAGAARVWVVVESVYSMDGDRAPLAELVALRRRYPQVMLYVDEAHAFGVLGPHGLGLSAALDERPDVTVGTLGKAAASMGAFAILDAELRSYCINRSRSLIFSTSLPPLQWAWSSYVVERICSDSHGAPLRERLAALAALMPSGRYIHPHIVGCPRRALELSRLLAARGMKVMAIRTPTVPPGTERLRVSLSAAHSPEAVSRLAALLDDFGKAVKKP